MSAESQGTAPKGAGGGHTPGPWETNPVGRHIYIEASLRPYVHQEVAACGPTESPEQQEANARLIAAAPELQVALEALLPYVEHSDSCGDHDAYNNAVVETCGCGLDSAVDAARAALANAGGSL